MGFSKDFLWGAAAASAQIEGDGFQAVSAQSVRVQDFQDRAETESRVVGIRSCSTIIEAD